MPAEAILEQAKTQYRSNQYSSAKTLFETAAKQGNFEAYRYLGLFHEKAQGTPRNISLAARYYLFASREFADAQNDLNRLLNAPDISPEELNEIGVVFCCWLKLPEDTLNRALPNYFRAKTFFEKARDRDSAQALRNLGMLHEAGQGGATQSAVRAAEYYQKAIDKGYEAPLEDLIRIRNTTQEAQCVTLTANAGEDKKNTTAKNKITSLEALCEIGSLYANGNNIGRNYTEARRWYIKAKDENYPKAFRELGFLVENGYGEPQNIPLAGRYYQHAIRRGFAIAQADFDRIIAAANTTSQHLNDMALGILEDLGPFPKPGNPPISPMYAAVDICLRRAAERGLLIAYQNLGTIYEQGFVVQKNYLKAAQYYELASTPGNQAESGFLTSLRRNPNVPATDLNAIGEMYHYARGVPQNYARAKLWYEQATDISGTNTKSALRNLGILYENGHGVIRDEAKAVVYYKKAAELGDPSAQCHLGRMYRDGRGGLKRNSAEALKWFLKAAEQEYEGVHEYLMPFFPPLAHYLQGVSAERNNDTNQATIYYQNSLDTSNTLFATLDISRRLLADPNITFRVGSARHIQLKAQAAFMIGRAYLLGLGKLPQNTGEANKYFLHASRLGYKYAEHRVNDKKLPELTESNMLELVKTNPAITIAFGTFKDLITRITNSQQLAQTRFDGEKTWLHYLPRIKLISVTPAEVERAIRAILSFEISPYDRSEDGYTAFSAIPAADPNNIKVIFRPGIFPDFIGVEEQIDKLRLFLTGIKAAPTKPSHFLLLSGTYGVGKTELMKKLAIHAGYEIREYEKGNEKDQWLGQLDTRVKAFFTSAKSAKKPICLLLDEIDSITPESDDTPTQGGRHDHRTTVTLIQQEITELVGSQVVLIGATNFPNLVKQAVKNRASEIVYFSLPNTATRLRIIQDFLRDTPVANPFMLQNLAAATVGCSPRILKSYTERVKDAAAREDSDNKPIEDKHFVAAFESTRKELRETHKTISLEPPVLMIDPDVDPFRDLIISDEVRRLSAGIIAFLKNPDVYRKRVGQNYTPNTLLYGPPGTGKTEFARAISSLCHCIFINIDARDYSTFGSEKQIKEIFTLARSFQRAVIFIDEIDVITCDGAFAKETIQTEMDGFRRTPDSVVVVIAGTNHLNHIAPPIKSRFGKIQEIALPTLAERIELFRLKLLAVDVPFDNSLLGPALETSCAQLGAESEGLGARDINQVIENAAALIVGDMHAGAQLTKLQITPLIREKQRAMGVPQPPQRRHGEAPP